ncbi:hypothetical protein PV04_04427 [Phialophora macrospora]|uniref:Uncharacterized protein n=1 Tax=Phialophora macrospora TaxID=1851006 RepID=A0A0D2FPJ2_9EURO|nr:hypothetical protein PV04_04427 [Phialophora macrospora]
MLNQEIQKGPYVRISPDEISVADLTSVKTIYRAGSTFRKADWYQKFNESPYPGIFSMIDAKAHATRRRLFAQSFSKSSLTKFEPQIRVKVQTAIFKIHRDIQRARADVLKWFTFMATDVIGELSFGESFNMLEQETKTPYIRDLETAMMISGVGAELGPLLKIAKWLPSRSVQDSLAITKRLDQYGLMAIANLKKHVTTAGDKGPGSLFTRFLDPAKNQELSLPEISVEASNLIVAGSDTTAVSLTYLIWSLHRLQHRHIKQKLLEEFAEVPIDAPLAVLDQLPYLHAVINESLRLYGAAPGSLPRVTPKGGFKLGGHYIPEDTIVSTQAYTMHRDESIFKDADRFIPERWENPTEAMKDAFFPFGLGSRVCIGLHLATSELQLGTFLFLKNCPTATLAESTTNESMEIENYFLIAPKSHRCELQEAK